MGQLLNMGIVLRLCCLDHRILLGKPILCDDPVAGVFQSLLYGHKASHIHISGACAALDGSPCAASEQCDGMHLGRKGQYALIFQQNHSLRRNLRG